MTHEGLTKSEARRLVRICVWEFLDGEGNWIFAPLLDKRDSPTVREAIEEEIAFLRKRALSNDEGAYGRYRDFVEHVYETRIDAKCGPGGARRVA